MPNWKVEDVITYAKRKPLTKLELAKIIAEPMTPQLVAKYLARNKRKPVTLTGRYNPKIVLAFFKEHGIWEPELEYKFHPERKWRFDFAWMFIGESGGSHKLALEVQGGIWSAGAHNRGAALLKEWEKLNEAAALGWRVIYCQPSDLCTMSTVELIKRCLSL